MDKVNNVELRALNHAGEPVTAEERGAENDEMDEAALDKVSGGDSTAAALKALAEALKTAARKA